MGGSFACQLCGMLLMMPAQDQLWHATQDVCTGLLSDSKKNHRHSIHIYKQHDTLCLIEFCNIAMCLTAVT